MVKPEPEKWGACRAEGSCAKASTGDDQVLGDGMETKAEYVKQGDLTGRRDDARRQNASTLAGQESECP